MSSCGQEKESVSAFCGNALVETGESCDDGNQVMADGCNLLCQVETDYLCFGSPSVCETVGNLCTDGVKNGNETGVDCGGPHCGKCGAGQSCGNDSDCVSANCLGSVCQ